MVDVVQVTETVVAVVPVVREIVLDIEKIISRFHSKYLNNEPASSGNASLVDHMVDAVHEVATAAGVKITMPAPVEAAAETVVKTALETALDKLEAKAAAEAAPVAPEAPKGA